MEPKGWGDGFVKDVAAGDALAVPDVGHYTATITKVDGRGRAPVSLELREFQPVEYEQRPLDSVRPRLILQADEDCWKRCAEASAHHTSSAPAADSSSARGRHSVRDSYLTWTVSSACAAAVVD